MASYEKEKGHLRIPHELMRKFLLVSRYLSAYELTVWLVIAKKTFGFQKAQDWIANSQFQTMSNIRRDHVCTIKKKLLQQFLIFKSGREIGIEQDWTKWRVHGKGGKIWSLEPPK